VFVSYKNIVCTLKWPSLKAKIGKHENQSLVGLTLWLKKRSSLTRALRDNIKNSIKPQMI
jgi:hypothetical protein